MMSKFKKDALELNTEPLLNDINNVLNKGIQKLLGDVLNRYEMLEQTHNAILNLPTIRELVTKNNSEIDFTELNEVTFETEDDNLDNIKNSVNTISCDEFLSYKQSTNDIINKLISQIDCLKNEISSLKDNQKSPVSEKENIKLEIEETEMEEEEEDIEEKPKYKVNVQLISILKPENPMKEVKEIKEQVVEKKVEENIEDEEQEEEEEEQEEEEQEEEVEDDIKSVETETKNEKNKEDEENEEEEELIEIEIDDKTYCTNDDNNGFIYELDEDGDVGKKVGYLKEGEAYFY
jgi:chemotaxis protein histidine kinase CheA